MMARAEEGRKRCEKIAGKVVEARALYGIIASHEEAVKDLHFDWELRKLP